MFSGSHYLPTGFTKVQIGISHLILVRRCGRQLVELPPLFVHPRNELALAPLPSYRQLKRNVAVLILLFRAQNGENENVL